MQKVTVRLSNGTRTMAVRLRKDTLGYLHIHSRTMTRIRSWLGEGFIRVDKVGGKDTDSHFVISYQDMAWATNPLSGYVAII